LYKGGFVPQHSLTGIAATTGGSYEIVLVTRQQERTWQQQTGWAICMWQVRHKDELRVVQG